MEFKASEIVKIIDACGKSGVSSFKMGELEMVFNGFVIQTESDYPKKADQVERLVVADPNFQLQQEFELDNEESEHLIISDPLAYEEKLMNGDFQESDSMVDNEI